MFSYKQIPEDQAIALEVLFFPNLPIDDFLPFLEFLFIYSDLPSLQTHQLAALDWLGEDFHRTSTARVGNAHNYSQQGVNK